MTIQLTPAERGALLHQIDQQLRLTADEAACLRRARDAQEVVQALVQQRADVEVVWI